MNPITTIDHNKFQDNQCACKGCNKQGRHYLKVLYVNKFGWFCDSCRDSLVSNRLIMEDDTPQRG